MIPGKLNQFVLNPISSISRFSSSLQPCLSDIVVRKISDTLTDDPSPRYDITAWSFCFTPVCVTIVSWIDVKQTDFLVYEHNYNVVIALRNLKTRQIGRFVSGFLRGLAR